MVLTGVCWNSMMNWSILWFLSITSIFTDSAAMCQQSFLDNNLKQVVNKPALFFFISLVMLLYPGYSISSLTYWQAYVKYVTLAMPLASNIPHPVLLNETSYYFLKAPFEFILLCFLLQIIKTTHIFKSFNFPMGTFYIFLDFFKNKNKC